MYDCLEVTERQRSEKLNVLDRSVQGFQNELIIGR
jgi:hypothetical protein